MTPATLGPMACISRKLEGFSFWPTTWDTRAAMGTVFFGLICLIALTYLMSAVVGRGKKAAPAPVPAAPQTAGEVTPELVAAVSAALAEELGTDITGIRIVSMKKM